MDQMEASQPANIRDHIRARGGIKYWLYDENDVLIKEGYAKMKLGLKNQVQNSGLAVVSSLVASDNPGSETGFDYMCIGISTGQAVTDSTLASEITTNGGERAATTTSQDIDAVTNDTIIFEKEWTFTGTFTVTEAGITNNSTADLGDMLVYNDGLSILVNSGFKLKLQWSVVFAGA